MTTDSPSSHAFADFEIDHRPWQRFFPPGVKPAIAPLPFTSLPEMVRQTAVRFPDRTAFSNLGVGLSFREVDALSDRFGAWLQGGLGLKPGDRVVLQMPNLLQYPIAMFGALKAGLIVVNANPLYTPPELEKVVADCEPRAIVVLANFASNLEQILPRTTLEHVIVTEVGDLLPLPKRLLVNAMVKRVRKLVPRFSIPGARRFREGLTSGHRLTPPTLGLEDVAFLQYTGGTTGGTKAAVLTHRNLLANQEQFIGQLRSRFGSEQARVLAALPLYHVFSLTVNCLGFFYLGAENILITNPRDTAGLVKTLRQTRPDAIILVNTLAAALLDAPGFAELPFERLKLTVAGGMAVRTRVAERWHEVTGQPLWEGYGLTEASPVVSFNPAHQPPRLGTIGIPLSSTDVQIRDDDGNALPIGEKGELAVRGPQVMRGYWNAPEETAKVLLDDGWLLTGDVAMMDEDGFLRIVDRKKETIVVSGFNVYPGEIEDAAVMHPKVLEAGVIGVEDPRSGEVPKLFAVKSDPSLTEAELRAHLKTRLASYKRPRHIEFRSELPKTNVGKVLRRALR